MPSYQDIETRLRVAEDKLDLIMKTFQITKRFKHPISDEIITETKTLLDIYREIKHMDLEVLNASDKAVETDGAV